MAPIQDDNSRDPKIHIAHARTAMKELIDHLRRDIDRVEEPRAQVLFETTAEVLKGLVQAYDDYDVGKERAFQRMAAV